MTARRYELRAVDLQDGETWISRSDSWREICADFRAELGCDGWRDVWIWDSEVECEFRPGGAR